MGGDGGMGKALAAGSLLELLFEDPLVGHCLVAPDGRVLRANREWLRATGLALDGALGANIVDLLPEERDAVLAMHALARAGHRVGVPRHARRIEGRETWWEGSIDPVPMDGGVGLLITTREVPRDLEALRQSDEQLHALGENLPEVAVYRYQLDGEGHPRFLYVSRRIEKLTGVSPEEVLHDAKSFEDLVLADDRQRLESQVTRSRETLTPFEMEVRVRHRVTGEERWALLRSFPVRGPQGVTVWDGIYNDITEMKRAEAALRDQERRYRWLFENSLDAVYVTRHSDGSILDANPAACALHGMSVSEIRERGRAGLVVADDRFAAAMVRRALHGEFRTELTLLRKDGTTFPAEVESTIVGPDGPGLTAFVIARDLTERNQTERALRASEERLRLFVEHAPAPIAMFDRDMRCLGASRRFLSDYRVSSQEVIGRSHYEAFPELPERWKEVHRRCLAGAVESCDEDSFLRPDGTLDWVRWEIHPWHTSAGEIGGIVLLSEVITERKRSMEALRNSADQLRASEVALREADRQKDQFLAMLSHELRNPLAPIRNSLYILERAAPGSEQAKRAQAVIDRQIGHMSWLIDELLDVTRIAHGKIKLHRELLDLNELAQRSVEDHRTLFLKSDARLEVRPAPAEVWVDGDRVRLAQIIGNLLQNAAKFTPRGGTVTVSLESDPARGQAILTVRDTGSGIAPEMLPRLFQPFSQAETTLERSKGGLGLGLALVKGLVELHGAR